MVTKDQMHIFQYLDPIRAGVLGQSVSFCWPASSAPRSEKTSSKVRNKLVKGVDYKHLLVWALQTKQI